MRDRTSEMGERSAGGADGSGVDRRTVLASGVAIVGGVSTVGVVQDGGVTQIAIVSSPAGFDDNAFNDNALEGLQQAAEEYDIEINQIEETETANYESVQASLAEDGSYDLIVLVASEHHGPLQTNAANYPDQNWMLINDHVEESNVSGWIEANNEMSFLAGVLAGTLTTEELSHEGSETDPETAHVGFVGGVDQDLINAFEQSYVEGAEWVAEDAEVTTGYAGSFNDATAAEQVAASQYDAGADLVYHAASAAGTGVFAAAEDAGRFAIGVDADQSVTEEQYQDVIVGSAVKYLNEATAEVATAVAEDDWERVAGRNELTIEDGGIDVVIGQAFEGDLPEIVDENLEAAKQALVDGEIELTCGPTGC